jgi:hypothetical protein
MSARRRDGDVAIISTPLWQQRPATTLICVNAMQHTNPTVTVYPSRPPGYVCRRAKELS